MSDSSGWPRLAFVCCCFFLLLTACSDGRQHATSDSAPVAGNAAVSDIPLGRLPAQVTPLHYRLRLAINPDQEAFSGQSEIDIRLAESSDTIWLHGKDLEVRSVRAKLENGEVLPGDYRQMADIGVARVKFQQALPAGKTTLLFDYSAPFNTSLEGLYKVKTGGRAYAFTQFEATSARFAFPGFDEPGFKSTFDISLEVDPNHRAVTTTPVVEEQTLDNGNKLLRYQTTKPLPTYLIAFMVGPLDERIGDSIPATDLRQRPVPLTAYAVQGKGEQLQGMLDSTAAIVMAEEEYFGHPYPYEKLSLIAVPDFGAGAMENVGAITYREQLILQTEATPEAARQRSRLVHAHELAHQWFGNLVTPEWWNDIWLNEAFATWMATKIVDRLYPQVGYRQLMLNTALETMETDRLVSARQIRQPIDSHADIGAAFDGITYQKGGAVLSMLEEFVGEEAFQRGIQNYLRSHRFGNADARDFVQAIAAARDDLPEGQIEAAFFSFLEQPGTPLVNLDWQCDDDGVTTVALSQSRYLPVGSSGDSDRSWVLPLCLAYDDAGQRQQFCQLVDQRQATFELPATACPTFIMPNANASGYYRWSLPEKRWEALLNSGKLNEREQLAAANSLSAAFHSGELDASRYLTLLPPLLASADAQVVSASLRDIHLMERQMVEDSGMPAFRNLVDQLYRPIYRGVGLDRNLDSPNQMRLRNSMLRLFADLVKDEPTREQLHTMAVNYLGRGGEGQMNPDALDPNIREVALHTAVEMEDSDFAERLLQLALASDNAVLREEILRAVTASKDADFRARLRELAVSEQIRDNEMIHILEPLMQNVATQAETWTWLRGNLDSVVARIPSWFQGRAIELASSFCSDSRRAEIETELGDTINALQRGPRSLANTLEQIQLCAALAERQGPDMRTMLEDR